MAKKKINNYKLINSLKKFSKKLKTLTNIFDIEELMSEILSFIYNYSQLKQELKRKYQNYNNASQLEKFRKYQENLNKAILKKLPDDLFHDTVRYQKYNIPKLFYYPAFFEMRGIVEIGSGLLDFYIKNYSDTIKNQLKIKFITKETKHALEDFNFYFITHIKLNETFKKEGQPEEFKLKFIYSIIIGVLDYFEKYISNLEFASIYKDINSLPHHSLPSKLNQIYNIINENSTINEIAKKMKDKSKNYRTTINNLKRLSIKLGFEKEPLNSIKKYKKEHAN